MTDLSQMIRWNTKFVRGLAQSVLDRAKVIRSSLEPYTSDLANLTQGKSLKKAASGKKAAAAPKTTAQKAARKAVKKVLKSTARKNKRTHA